MSTSFPDTIEPGFSDRMHRQYCLDATLVDRQSKMLATDQGICRAFYGTAFSACQNQADSASTTILCPSQALRTSERSLVQRACDVIRPSPAAAFEDFDRIVAGECVGNYSTLFARRRRSWHGVRELNCPDDKLRKVFIVVINRPILYAARRVKNWIKKK